MSKLTGLLVMDLFGSAPLARLAERRYYDLNELNYRRLQALISANPALQPLLQQALVIERESETLCLIPVDVVETVQQSLDEGSATPE
jgi:hypothetical protein